MKNLKYILPALGDAGLGLIAASLAVVFFEAPLSFLFIIWSLAWAYLPDLDGAIHAFYTGHFVADIENGRDHRDGLHYPLGWALMFMIWAYFFGVTPWLIVAVIAILFHFVHDMIGIGWGIKIFAPIDSGSYRLFSKKWVSADVSLSPVIIRYSADELKQAIIKYGETDWIERYFCRWTHVSIVDYFLFGIGVVSISILYFL